MPPTNPRAGWERTALEVKRGFPAQLDRTGIVLNQVPLIHNAT